MVKIKFQKKFLLICNLLIYNIINIFINLKVMFVKVLSQIILLSNLIIITTGYMGAMELATGMPPGMEMMKPDQMMSQSTDDGNNEEESSPSPNLHIPHGPSPEPKIEDSECHRSQSAMYSFLY
jgi:hypothetical protein